MNRRTFLQLTGAVTAGSILTPSLFAEKEKIQLNTETIQITPSVSVEEIKQRRFGPQWIPMTEQLPKVGEKFLFLKDYKNENITNKWMNISLRKENHIKGYIEIDIFQAKRYKIEEPIDIREWINKANKIINWEHNFFKNLRGSLSIPMKNEFLRNGFFIRL